MKAATAESTLKSTKKVLEDELAQEELVEFLDMDMDKPTEAARDLFQNIGKEAITEGPNQPIRYIET